MHEALELRHRRSALPFFRIMFQVFGGRNFLVCVVWLLHKETILARFSSKEYEIPKVAVRSPWN
jgi:hypothetical protein